MLVLHKIITWIKEFTGINTIIWNLEQIAFNSKQTMKYTQAQYVILRGLKDRADKTNKLLTDIKNKKERGD